MVEDRDCVAFGRPVDPDIVLIFHLGQIHLRAVSRESRPWHLIGPVLALEARLPTGRVPWSPHRGAVLARCSERWAGVALPAGRPQCQLSPLFQTTRKT